MSAEKAASETKKSASINIDAFYSDDRFIITIIVYPHISTAIIITILGAIINGTIAV
jgi:hypothetical protein